jgi:hypothetical protein
MSNVGKGLLAGLVFGAVAVLIMLPMKFPDKSAALSGAFISRFVIGLVIAVAVLPVSGWLKGLIFGVLMSLPDAIVTGSYLPILALGAVGGTVIGWIVD